MSKSAATNAIRCRLNVGGFCVVLTALLVLPPAAMAGNSEQALRRSDQIDVNRLGKVSEDERSVLRIEWRAGLAAVEETRNVHDMLDKLRRLETGINDVSQLVRNMPANAPAVAAAAPVAAAIPAVAATPDADGYDVRLIVANLAALALVTLWWIRRRKPAPVAGTAPTVPHARTSLDDAAPSTALVVAPVQEASRDPDAETGTEHATGDAADAAEPAEATSGADPDPAGESSVVATEAAAGANADAASPAQVASVEAFRPDQTMVIDFSLQAADPEVVARENAKLEALRQVTPSEPPAAPQSPQKGDVEPTLQLAEIMLSMGLEQGAAQALIEYIETHPRHAVYHWLKLLGIYRSRGLQKEFAETAEKLRTHFNIQAEEWGSSAKGDAPKLENFSRVAEHVQKIWSQPAECMDYLQHLLEDNREGARAGFPQSVAEEILFLVEILKENRA